MSSEDHEWPCLDARSEANCSTSARSVPLEHGFEENEGNHFSFFEGYKEVVKMIRKIQTWYH